MTDENNALFDEMFRDKVNEKQKEKGIDVFDIVLVLDRSGSMNKIRDDAIGGVNTFIEEQKKEGGEVYFSLIQFDTAYGDPAYWRKPLTGVELLTRDTFIPRGGTALLDAIGRTVAAVRERRALGEITGKVQFVIQTDGDENSSHEYRTKQSVADLVDQVKEEGWGDFIFLGANIDAFSEGRALGFSLGSTATYADTSDGVRGATYFASAQTKAFRYGATLDAADVKTMQESLEAGINVAELYASIDAKIDRGVVDADDVMGVSDEEEK